MADPEQTRAGQPSSSSTGAKLPFAHLTFLGGSQARSTSASRAHEAPTFQEDCLSCRLLGTSACGVGASVVLWEIYKEPRRPLSHKYAMGAFAAAFIALGAYRAVM